MNQYNHITGAEYQGRNQVALQSATAKYKYTSNAWLTFVQARGNGLKVNKGSHGVKIVSPFISGSKTESKDGKIVTTQKTFIPRTYTVFNLNQVTKL